MKLYSVIELTGLPEIRPTWLSLSNPECSQAHAPTVEALLLRLEVVASLLGISDLEGRHSCLL